MNELADELRSEGFTTELRLSDQSPKPGTALNVSGEKILAYFSNWNTGEADYEIIDKAGMPLSSQWGLLLDDNSFEAAFRVFAEKLRTAERGG